MQCQQCGTNFEGNFCPVCGASAAPPVPPVQPVQPETEAPSMNDAATAAPEQQPVGEVPPVQPLPGQPMPGQVPPVQPLPGQPMGQPQPGYAMGQPPMGQPMQSSFYQQPHLMGEPEPKKPFYKQWWFILVAVLVAVGVIVGIVIAFFMPSKSEIRVTQASSQMQSDAGDRNAWSSVILKDKLPEPPNFKGEIGVNEKDVLMADVHDVSEQGFKDYIKACKDKGYTENLEEHKDMFDAYNKEGYHINLMYMGSEKYYYLDLTAPKEMKTIQWPKGKAGQLLPVPKSNKGHFDVESDDYFSVSIADTSSADFQKYVEACQDKGFTVGYNKSDDYFSAQNKEGWHLSLSHEKNDVMKINITAPLDLDMGESSTTTSTKSAAQSSAGTSKTKASSAAPNVDGKGIRPEFKAFMDEYEAFLTDYVDFLKKFVDDPTNLDLASQADDYLKKAQDMEEQSEAWQKEDLTMVEISYALDVAQRVDEKMQEINDLLEQ